MLPPRASTSAIPFGIGQRQCIGKELALMEGQFILARLLQRYRVSAVPGRTTRLHVATTLRTSGSVWLWLDPRAGR
ncbi:cytochrome P450 [Sorangium sp. So ce726]|uniref:cytochrome P450 n=1 Tax=Sorangium sp. So ce726 TaxID=3133319 RepID=UPI003F61C485